MEKDRAPKEKIRFGLPLKLGVGVVLFFAAVLATCLLWRPVRERWNEWKLNTLRPTGRPSWFPLGKEVYNERDRFQAQESIVSFQNGPRWFLAFPDPDAKDLANQWIDVPAGFHHYPKRIEDIPLTMEGASLHLTVREADTPETMRFVLKLKSNYRNVRREVEQGRTNLLPFLFAFFPDGKAVNRLANSCDREWGAAGLRTCVVKNGTGKWYLEVRTESVETIISNENAEALLIVAAFSERKHEDYHTGVIESDWRVCWNRSTCEIPQILIRSNIVRLVKQKGVWTVKDKEE
ncbi:MAG: hypothetical protein E3J72_09455 [Planctomycetota bacterium]|nr:MAG: hypothetical protein E3J72_09455 [Planctomycetota bacterium]